MKSVILAGGLGTRLLPYTLFVPKPMLPLGEKPILEHLIEWNRQSGIDEFVLCVSYLGRVIEDYFGDGERLDVSIKYARSKKPMATAGQLKMAQGMLSGTFVCMYGDSLYDFDLASMLRMHARRGAFITMGLHQHRSTLPYGVIDTDGDGLVVAWREKPQTVSQINMGCYILEPGVMSYIPDDTPWGMDAVIRSAISDDRTVLGYPAQGTFTDVGTCDSYMEIGRQYRQRLGDI